MQQSAQGTDSPTISHPSILFSTTDIDKSYTKMKEKGIIVGDIMRLPYGNENDYVLREGENKSSDGLQRIRAVYTLKSYFEALGYNVKGEVRHCDMVVMKVAEPEAEPKMQKAICRSDLPSSNYLP